MLDFGHLKGKHLRENLANYTYLLLNSYGIKQKLFAITGDNASNNNTLCCYLYRKLKREFNNEVILNSTKPMMQFHGENSYIRCLAHIINLICKAILKELKASTYKEAKAILDAMSASTTDEGKIFRKTNAQTAIVKLRLLIM